MVSGTPVLTSTEITNERQDVTKKITQKLKKYDKLPDEGYDTVRLRRLGRTPAEGEEENEPDDLARTVDYDNMAYNDDASSCSER